ARKLEQFLVAQLLDVLLRRRPIRLALQTSQAWGSFSWSDSLEKPANSCQTAFAVSGNARLAAKGYLEFVQREDPARDALRSDSQGDQRQGERSPLQADGTRQVHL